MMIAHWPVEWAPALSLGPHLPRRFRCSVLSCSPVTALPFLYCNSVYSSAETEACNLAP